MAEPRTNPRSEHRKDNANAHGGRSTEAIVRALLDHLNGGDRSRFMDLLAPDAAQVEPAAGLEFRGPSDIAANFWSYRNTFPDLHATVTNLFACGTHAVAELTLRGTYEPYTYGRNAKTITWYGCFVMEVKADKIAHIAVYADRLNMLDQLDALPLAPEAPSSNPHGFFYRRLEPIVDGPSPLEAPETISAKVDAVAPRDGSTRTMRQMEL